MALELERTALEDPFAKASLFSLLPRTLKFTSDAELTAVSDSQELESFQSFLKSMTMKGSKELLEQAQAVKQISSKLLDLNTKDGDKVSVEDDDKGQPQVRRPALGRKRAQFSLKPLSRDPLPSVDINSSIDLIEDPEEYFSVFEKLENADKELKKLRGEVPTDLVQRHQSAATRERRRGILGKTAYYKHHFPTQGNAAEGTIKSQEVTERTFSTQLSIPANTVSTTTVQPEQIDESNLLVGCKENNNNLDNGSTGEKEKKIDRLLDELFSSFEGLDGNKEVAFLRERLQIKSIDVGKMCLPEMPGFKKNDLDAVTTMVSSNNLMVVNNVESRRKAKGSQLAKTSPILLSSPLAAISMLQRRIPLKSPARDPYLMHPSDNIQYAGESFQSDDQGQHPLSPVDLGHHAISGSIDDAASTPVRASEKKRLKSDKKLQSPDSSALRVDIDLGIKIASEESPTVNFPSSLGINDDCTPIGNNINEDVTPIECDSCLEDGNNMPMDASLPEQPEPGHEVLTSECVNNNNIDYLASQPGKRLGENADASPVTRFDVTTGGKVNHMSSGGDPISKIAGHEGNSTGIQEVDLPMHEHSEDSCVIPEGNNEEQGPGADSKAPKRRVNKKPPARKQKKPNPDSRRYSLAGAGTSWDAGVRRSTRIKSRPLQYWCGERFLYGRIHDSMATVIGVKYASPSDSKLKVKSFVSDQYADLVVQAALH